jgi:hypothetical protein
MGTKLRDVSQLHPTTDEERMASLDTDLAEIKELAERRAAHPRVRLVESMNRHREVLDAIRAPRPELRLVEDADTA